MKNISFVNIKHNEKKYYFRYMLLYQNLDNEDEYLMIININGHLFEFLTNDNIFEYLKKII